ncbi:hypothetical protein SAMN05444392_104129 [Seinonella peptonophila]|uniref:Serine aminopeptidase S33 domain-containing protein n=1 Tax=Seinonella peptonophila TaxID=112248 RepID=A0A1M4X536_9BACL|nr:alpha/beta hydrolase [Seinonella peptonophila]SHE88614.1 hypothetical protein SAMN05444392_104129 [Seinonella peptonophila]
MFTIVVISISLYGFYRITQTKKQLADRCFQIVENRGLYSRQEFSLLPKEEVTIKSKDGHQLHGYYIDAFPEQQDVVMIVHGYTVAYPWSMQFASVFLKKRFNLLVIDQRAHGESEGRYTTYGVQEKYDIERWVEWLRTRKGRNVRIGFHGQSLGGGTVLEYSRLSDEIMFMIIDCSYADFSELVKYQIRRLYRVPLFPVYYLIQCWVYLFARFKLSEVKPITASASSKFPILFIHGSHDWFIPPSMSKQLYDAKKVGKKELVFIEGAGHGNSLPHNRKRYEQVVKNFLNEISLEMNQSNKGDPIKIKQGL